MRTGNLDSNKSPTERRSEDKKIKAAPKPEPTAPEAVPTVDLNTALDIIVTALLPQAIEQANVETRSSLSCLLATLRTLLKVRVYPDGRPAKKAMPDGRARNWDLKTTFRTMIDSEVVGEGEYFGILGLAAVQKIIMEDIEDMHDEEDLSKIDEFKQANMSRRMGGMVASISRAGGAATMSIFYTLANGDKCKLDADISRA